jgi:hypothetical protein
MRPPPQFFPFRPLPERQWRFEIAAAAQFGAERPSRDVLRFLSRV